MILKYGYALTDNEYGDQVCMFNTCIFFSMYKLYFVSFHHTNISNHSPIQSIKTKRLMHHILCTVL